MIFSRHGHLFEHDSSLKFQVTCKCLPDFEDTLEPLNVISKDVLALFEKLLCRKSNYFAVVKRARRQLVCLEGKFHHTCVRAKLQQCKYSNLSRVTEPPAL